MMQKILFNIVILIICYINTAFSSEELMERRPLIHYAIPLSIEEVMMKSKEIMTELSPDIMLCLCQRVSLQDVKHLSEVSKHYAKYIRPQILPMKAAAQQLNCKIDIEQNPSNLQLKFIKAILTNNFKFRTYYNHKSNYAKYGIKDDGNMITIDDHETPPYYLLHKPNKKDRFGTLGEITSTVNGFNFRHVVGKIYATEKKNSLGLYQAHIKTNEEERFLEHPDKIVSSSPIMISADSNSIVGRMTREFYDGGNIIVPFICTNQQDMKQLLTYYPHEKFSFFKSGYASCVSGNGKVIGGLIDKKPAVWIDSTLPFLLEDFIKAPKSMNQKLTLTDFCQISWQGMSWFGYGHYTAVNRAVRKLYWIIKFDFNEEVIAEEENLTVLKKRKRTKDPQSQ